MALTAEIRIWRTIIRATWLAAALIGVAVASIPSVRFSVVVAATLLAGACAFAFMVWSAKQHGGSLRRPARIKQSPGVFAVILAVAGAIGALIGVALGAILVLDAPQGMALPMAVVLGGIGGEMLGRLWLRLARRSASVSEPGSPTAGIG